MSETGLIARLVVIGFDVFTAGIAEVCVPKANRTRVIDHNGDEAQIMAHTVCSFLLVGLSGFFVVDSFFFPKRSCFTRLALILSHRIIGSTFPPRLFHCLVEIASFCSFLLFVLCLILFLSACFIFKILLLESYIFFARRLMCKNF